VKILIVNPGSTSYKCKLFEMPSFTILFQAAVDRIGDADGNYFYQVKTKDKITETVNVPDYFSAVNLTLNTIKKYYRLDEISAVGFKTVLAKGISGCVELDEAVVQAMEDYLPLAPVHTQVYLTAISVIKQILPGTPLMGLFETAFHVNIPSPAYLYGIPYEYYEKYGIRKYGFHGASHRYVAERIKELFFPQKDSCKVISCHLGGSSSVCAINGGMSIDTSMGMSPQSGLLNAKRTGDFDSYALLYLMEKENLSIQETRNLLMSKSGLLGISGRSGDFRDIEAGMEQGYKRDELAFKTFAYYVKRYIGEYLAILNGADCVVFTAGAGQNSPHLREEILQNMENIGLVLDHKKNQQNPMEGLISSKKSPIKIAVVPTNEELIVAREVARKFKKQASDLK
jgi:acetate kinase